MEAQLATSEVEQRWLSVSIQCYPYTVEEDPVQLALLPDNIQHQIKLIK